MNCFVSSQSSTNNEYENVPFLITIQPVLSCGWPNAHGRNRHGKPLRVSLLEQRKFDVPSSLRPSTHNTSGPSLPAAATICSHCLPCLARASAPPSLRHNAFASLHVRESWAIINWWRFLKIVSICLQRQLWCSGVEKWHKILYFHVEHKIMSENGKINVERVKGMFLHPA